MANFSILYFSATLIFANLGFASADTCSDKFESSSDKSLTYRFGPNVTVLRNVEELSISSNPEKTISQEVVKLRAQPGSVSAKDILASEQVGLVLGFNRYGHSYSILRLGDRYFRFDGNAFMVPVEISETAAVDDGILIKTTIPKNSIEALYGASFEETALREIEGKKYFTCVTATCEILKKLGFSRTFNLIPAVNAESLIVDILLNRWWSEKASLEMDVFLLNVNSITSEFKLFDATTSFGRKAFLRVITFRQFFSGLESEKAWVAAEHLKLEELRKASDSP
jgi:hypothetical protein